MRKAAEKNHTESRVLIYATTAYMIDQFNRPNIRMLQNMGCTVDAACNFRRGNPVTKERLQDFRDELDAMGVAHYQMDLTRNILDIYHNGGALIKTIRLLRSRQYDFVHCHTPVGAVIARLACAMTGTRVIYTAHGFHFFDGAPWVNWAVYYPVEMLFSYITDVLVTINREDYQRARDRFHMKRLEYVPGVGINLALYRASESRAENAASEGRETERDSVRREFGVGQDKFLMLSVGELSKRKNHMAALKAIVELEKDAPELYDKIVYLIVGTGVYENQLQHYIDEHGMHDKIILTGYRTDVDRICRGADGFLFPSLQEGLPAALMEAMATRLPAAVSRIRGNTDLIDEEGGILFKPDSGESIEAAIRDLLSLTPEQRKKMGEHNAEVITSTFSLMAVSERMEEIYRSMGCGEKSE